MTKKDGETPEVPETPEPPAPPESKKPTPENLEQWQEHATRLEAQITALAAELKEAREAQTPAPDLKPLETALAEVKAQAAATAETLAKIQKALEERPPSRSASDGPPEPKPGKKAKAPEAPEPKRKRSAWV
jgi:DNA repair exonuclease SbcCD ATPase subunit